VDNLKIWRKMVSFSIIIVLSTDWITKINNWRKTMINKKWIPITALAALAACATTAENDDFDVLPKSSATFVEWGEAEGWDILVDTSRGTCLIERVDTNGTVVQMGLTSNAEFGYLGVFTQADVSPKDNLVHVSLDGKQYYGDAEAQTSKLKNGYKGGYILANNQNFVNDVMKKYVMSVYPEDANTFDVSLDGTNEAIKQARQCNAEQTS